MIRAQRQVPGRRRRRRRRYDSASTIRFNHPEESHAQARELDPFLCFVLAAPLAAGTIVNAERRELPDGTPSPLVITVDGNLVSISGAAGDGRVIFRGDRQQMLIVDDEEKSYMALNEAMVDGIAKQLDAATQQMEAAIAKLPADQQAMARRLMQQQQQQQQPPPPQVRTPASAARAEAALDDSEQVRRTAESGTHAGYQCTKYEVLEEGVKVRELWVTDWDNVEGHAELEAAMQSMDRFLDKLTASFGKLGGAGSQMGSSQRRALVVARNPGHAGGDHRLREWHRDRGVDREVDRRIEHSGLDVRSARGLQGKEDRRVGAERLSLERQASCSPTGSPTRAAGAASPRRDALREPRSIPRPAPRDRGAARPRRRLRAGRRLARQRLDVERPRDARTAAPAARRRRSRPDPRRRPSPCRRDFTSTLSIARQSPSTRTPFSITSR